MKQLLLLAGAFCLFFPACKKTEIPAGFNDPVFWSSFGTNTQDSSLVTAGLNGVYLFTGYEVNNGIFRSITSFADVNCPAGDCPGSLTFEYHDKAPYDSLLFDGIIRYTVLDSLVQNPLAYNTRFYWGDFYNVMTTQTFMLSNDSNSYSSPTQSVYLDLFDSPVEATLIGYGANGLNGRTVQTILPHNNSAYPAVSIKATPNGSGYTLTAVQDFNRAAVVSYQWSTGEDTNTIVIDSLSAFQEYFVTVYDAADHTAVASLASLPFPSQITIRNAGLSYQAAFAQNYLQRKSIAIQWVDANGVVWRSDWSAQPPGFSIFEAMEETDYSPNEKGDWVRKLRVRFKCKLFSASGDSQDFEGVGVIGFALS